MCFRHNTLASYRLVGSILLEILGRRFGNKKKCDLRSRPVGSADPCAPQETHSIFTERQITVCLPYELHNKRVGNKKKSCHDYRYA